MIIDQTFSFGLSRTYLRMLIKNSKPNECFIKSSN